MPLPRLRLRPAPRRRPRTGRRSYTLVEIVLAAALAVLVFAALQSTVMVACKAIPGTGSSSELIAQSGAIGRLQLDLAYARSIDARRPFDLVLTVQDRNADSADDTVEYSWSGVMGDPLVRIYNGSNPEAILPDVKTFACTFTTTTVQGKPSSSESAESLLASYTKSPPLTYYPVQASDWPGQVFQLAFPQGTIAWNFTRLRLYIRDSTGLLGGPASGADGKAAFEIRTLRSGAPSGHVLDSANMDESDMGNAGKWNNFPFANLRNLDPADTLCLVVRCTASCPSAEIGYNNSGLPPSSRAMVTTANAGSTWTASATNSLLYEIYGTIVTAGATPTINAATSMLLSVQNGSTPVLELSLPLAARPELMQ